MDAKLPMNSSSLASLKFLQQIVQLVSSCLHFQGLKTMHFWLSFLGKCVDQSLGKISEIIRPPIPLNLRRPQSGWLLRRKRIFEQRIQVFNTCGTAHRESCRLRVVLKVTGLMKIREIASGPGGVRSILVENQDGQSRSTSRLAP